MLSNNPSVSFGAASRSRAGFSGSKCVSFSHDENAIARKSNTKNGDTTHQNKTPATNKAGRRALGDISNRAKGGTVARKSSSSHRVPSVEQRASATTSKIDPRKIPFGDLSNKPAKKSNLSFTIPDETSMAENVEQTQKSRPSSTSAKSTARRQLDDSWFLEEPEKPFGMLYSEQIKAWGDGDDDSVVSLEGVANLKETLKQYEDNMRSQYVESIKKGIDEELQAQQNDIEEFYRNNDHMSPPENDYADLLDGFEDHLLVLSDTSVDFQLTEISFG